MCADIRLELGDHPRVNSIELPDACATVPIAAHVDHVDVARLCRCDGSSNSYGILARGKTVLALTRTFG
jgi:hypothetical protein